MKVTGNHTLSERTQLGFESVMKSLQSSTFRLWLLSFLIAVTAIVMMNYKWVSVSRLYGSDTSVIRNESQLGDFLQSQKGTVEFSGDRDPYQILTGFFIQSLAFVTASDVNLTGYIWQKYPEDYPQDWVKGIIFPEEVNSVNTRLDKLYETTGEQNGVRYDMIGWYFDVTVRQSFDYSNYPLDILTVWLRVWHKDLLHDKEVVLVPDFNAYANVDKSTFGLDTEIVHGEWTIDETFFSYKSVPYDTDFGISADIEEHSYNEFFFNLGVRRKFINAFIVNLVPLFVVALLLFAQLLTVSGKEELIDRLGFNMSDTIAAYSAMFFIILLAHIQVRSQFADSGLVYIEYFYLIMYLAILLSAINLYLFSLGKLPYLNILHYQDNLVAKAAYWPIVLGTMAIATWVSL
ncbi:MAG: hypothetical protein LGR52_10495 [Candidatus Thiosymbion ectosymbiont of Robbea hypermnestra]|nr:hypothetical protein [Candidatus Thiosymbion ectosymbiont of Robbea hypermnestra]